MQREYVLVGTAVAVMVVAGFVGVFVSDVVATPEEPVRDDHLSLSETRLTSTNVTEDSATLEVTNWLTHSGGPSANVSVLVRAIDTDTGLVDDTTRRNIGTVSRADDRPVPIPITVKRSGGYRIETLVFVDGERVDSQRNTVSGVQALKPEQARTGLRFHGFDRSLPTITYRIDDVTDGDVTIETTTYLTNGGDEVAGDLELIVRARQVDSNTVADRAVVSVEDVRSGRTTTPTAMLTVPDNYSYQLDAILMRDDVVVDTETAIADLNPTRTVTTNESVETASFDAGDYDDGNDQQERPRTTRDAGGPDGSGSGPGFGVALALVAIVGCALLLTRRTHD